MLAVLPMWVATAVLHTCASQVFLSLEVGPASSCPEEGVAFPCRFGDKVAHGLCHCAYGKNQVSLEVR